MVGGAGVVLQRGAAQRGPSGLAVVVERQSLCLDVFPAAALARRRPLGVDRVQEVRRVVRAAVVDPLIFFLFSEMGHFCELGGSREPRRPFRRKAGAKRFTCRPGGLHEPRGRPDLKNDRLLNLLACDKMVAEAALATKWLRKQLKARGVHSQSTRHACDAKRKMRARSRVALCLGAGSAPRGSIPVASATQQPK